MKKLLLIQVLISLLFADMAILKEDANIRDRASLNSKVIDVGLKGDKLQIIQKVHTKTDGTWYQTQKGYIALDLVDIEYDLAKLYNLDNNVSYIYSEDILTIYADSNNSEDSIATLEAYKYEPIICQKFINGYKYLWYKTQKGWINGSYVVQPKFLTTCKDDNIVEDEEILVSSLEEEIQTNSQLENNITQDVKKEPEEHKQELKVEEKPKTEDKIVEVKQTKIEQKHIDLFAGVMFGFNNLSINTEQISGSTIDLQTPLDNTGLSGNLHLGIRYNKNYQVILNYDYITLDDVTLNNFYLSVNYQFQNRFNPYIGLSSGLSLLKWKSDPLGVSDMKESESKAGGFIGLQTGLEYFYNQQYSFITQFLYQEFFHETQIVDGSNEALIKHDRVIQFGIGFRYWF